MNLVMIHLKRDTMTTLPLIVGRHEIPILEDIHGPGTLTVVDENYGQQVVESADAEFERLSAKYGRDPDTGIPYVERSYGRNMSAFQDVLADAPASRRSKAA